MSTLDQTGPVSHSFFYRLCHNKHVKAELSAIIYLVVAIGALYVGLHIAPIVCLLIAVGIVIADLYDWTHPPSSPQG